MHGRGVCCRCRACQVPRKLPSDPSLTPIIAVYVAGGTVIIISHRQVVFAANGEILPASVLIKVRIGVPSGFLL
jgi:hypothetical protein